MELLYFAKRVGCFSTVPYPLFSLLYLSSPILAEQFYFTLQSAEISFGMLLCLASVYFAGKLVYVRQMPARACFYALAALVCMIWAFGTYQSFFVFYIVLVLISYLLNCIASSDEETPRRWFWIGLKMFLLFLTGFVGWYFTNCIICKFFLPKYPYNTTFIWDLPRNTIIQLLKIQCGQIYLKNTSSLYFSVWFTPALILFVVSVLFKVRHNLRKLPWILFALVVYGLSPILLLVIAGGYIPVRSMYFYPLIFAFAFVFVISVCGRSWIRCLLILLLLSCVRSQSVSSFQLQESTHIAYENDRTLLTRIIGRMEETAGTRISEYPVVFVGKISPDYPILPMGENNGHSFFEWDASYYAGGNGRIAELAAVMGVELTMADDAQRISAVEYSDNMEPWPSRDSIRIHDGVLIVKLSSPEKVSNLWWYSNGWHHWDDKPVDNDLLRSQWLEENGEWYYFDQEGIMATGDRVIDGTRYQFDMDGKWIDEDVLSRRGEDR